MMGVKIAVAGATGELGIPIVNALLAANYSVTALTRKGSTNASKLPTNSLLSVVEVDYSSLYSLTAALKDHTIVVSTLTSTSVDSQGPLIDASVAAGVTRFIPSEFGSDIFNQKRNQLPVFEGKVMTLEYLKTIVAKNSLFSYTVICNGAFLDWGLQGFLVNVPEHTATIYNGGDVPFSATNLETIGRAIVGVAENLSATANRPVYIQDAVVTQNSLIRYAEEKDGIKWKITHRSTETMYSESLAQVAKGIIKWEVMQPFVFCSVFGEGYGEDFSNRLDNKLLGLEGLTEPEVRVLVETLLMPTATI